MARQGWGLNAWLDGDGRYWAAALLFWSATASLGTLVRDGYSVPLLRVLPLANVGGRNDLEAQASQPRATMLVSP